MLLETVTCLSLSGLGSDTSGNTALNLNQPLLVSPNSGTMTVSTMQPDNQTVADANTPATAWQDLTTWLHSLPLSNFVRLSNLPSSAINFPAPANQPVAPVGDFSPKVNKTRVIEGNVTLEASSDVELDRIEKLMKRINQRLGHPVLQNLHVVIDDTMGDIGKSSGTGNQAAYQSTRDATNGKIYQESLHINGQFLDYLSHQTVTRAEAYLAAVIFHESSHREVLAEAEREGKFHQITQADETNANERSEAAIARNYPEYFSWLQTNYYELFKSHFNQAYGALPSASAQDLAIINAGNTHFNRTYIT